MGCSSSSSNLEDLEDAEFERKPKNAWDTEQAPPLSRKKSKTGTDDVVMAFVEETGSESNSPERPSRG